MDNAIRLRCWLYIVALCGCDKLFTITHVDDPPRPPDAAFDVPAIDALPDVAIDAPTYFEGCADRTREGFADVVQFPALAACAGAWSVPGLRPEPVPMCNRAAGNNGSRMIGNGCSAADLCAPDWHVCRTRLEVLSRASVGCSGLMSAANTFFATGQSGPGGGNCNDTGTDDFFGCATYGTAAQSSCALLDKSSNNDCSTIDAVGGWQCAAPDEVVNVVKTDWTTGGGVLCCRDQL